MYETRARSRLSDKLCMQMNKLFEDPSPSLLPSFSLMVGVLQTVILSGTYLMNKLGHIVEKEVNGSRTQRKDGKEE